MANNKYQEGGGKWFGGETMEGIMGKQFREFMAAFKSKMRLQAKKLKKRGLIKDVGTFLNKWTQIPVFSTIAEAYAQDKYKLDPTLDVEAGMYTGGLKKEAEEQLSDLKKRADVSIAESLTTAGLDWVGTKAGDKVIGKKIKGATAAPMRDLSQMVDIPFRALKQLPFVDKLEEMTGRELMPGKTAFDMLYGQKNGSQNIDESSEGQFEGLNETEIIDKLKELGIFKQGGQVSKYYGGGSVNSSPTISDYFSQQGKTLGGSNLESLSEQLNRK